MYRGSHCDRRKSILFVDYESGRGSSVVWKYRGNLVFFFEISFLDFSETMDIMKVLGILEIFYFFSSFADGGFSDVWI
jgi:hypothetical protein